MSTIPDHLPPRRSARRRIVESEPVPDPTIVEQAAPGMQVRNIRIVAFLLSLLCFLILLALLSYTQRDEANAQLTARDLFGTLKGTDDLRLRFETTHNWLGLLGAVISHWLFTNTVGIWSVAFPILGLLAAWDLYRFQKISPLLTKRSVATVLSTIIVSSIVGTAQLVSWLPEIGTIYSGAVGQFFAGVLTPIIGSIGSFLFFFTALFFTVSFGFTIPVDSLTALARRGCEVLMNVVRTKATKRHDPDQTESIAGVADTVSERSSDDGSVIVRPARSSADGVTIVRSGAEAGIASKPVVPSEKPVDAALGKQDKNVRYGLDEVQRRSATTSLDSSILNPIEKGPSDPGDVPELPLFLNDDDETDTNTNTPTEESGAEPTLIVNVEEKVHREPEVELSNVTLYDENIVYKPPPASLLVEGTDEVSVNEEELRTNAKILQDKLETFRIKIENLTVQPGPVVTQYEFVPASGIKVSQIESLADDISLALKAPAVRIQAPVPGKGTVGIEIPNLNPSLVRFSSIIKSKKYHNPDIKLPIALGKTAVGDVYCADLTKMPHLLIAGATGKGKSVGINTLIASLIYRMHPRDLKFVIVDPKRVEMSLYRELKNHFLAVSPDIDETIVTEPANAVTILKNVVEEMQLRYNILAGCGQRNIADYNRKVKDGKIKDKDGIKHRPMPYIVVIIDELADLMMTAGKDVEEPIVRLAQLARAVGIHCVVATQRPSVDVVTGLIKANFPARIAYQVSARVDSRTILDTSGAEHLIGNGDMLFAPGNTPKPIRMQNAFISTEEVEALCEHIGKQKGYKTPYILPSIAQKRQGGTSTSDDVDVLFADAARIFIQLQQASVSTLQRRLKIGYARAARIVDELESAGIVGPPDGSKGRSVLLQSESELEAYL